MSHAAMCAPMIAALALAAALSGASPAPAAEAERIAFVRGGDIWTTASDGTSQRIAVRRGTAPRWSPDGRSLAFLRDGEAWVVRPGTQAPRQVSHTGGHAARVAWRSARALLVVRETRYDIRYRREGKEEEAQPEWRDILLVPLDGAPATLWLGTERSAGAPRDHGGGQLIGNFDCPAVSPDGKTVAFAKDGDLWMSDPAALDHRQGGFLRRVAAVARWGLPMTVGDESSAGITGLAWLPDGKGVVYGIERYAGGGIAEIWTSRADGSGRRMLVHLGQAAGGICTSPVPLPGGREVLFQSGGSAGWELWAVSLHGGTLRRVVREAEL